VIQGFTRVLFLFIFSINAVGQQTSFQVWTETGVRGKITKKLDWNLSLTNRIQDYKLVTMFPQFSLKYKVLDWFKPSIDYRLISNREDNGNYTNNHRINFNLQFEQEIKRLSVGFRFRYQYSFKGFSTNYEPEFDNAIRLKPSLSYDIKKSYFTPIFSSEFFFNPSVGPFGERLTRIRTFFGLDINLKGPHELQVGYFFDQKINLPRSNTRNVLNVQYSYNLSSKKKNKEER
jgi:hypothetical protein